MAGLIDADGGLDFGTGLAWLTGGIGQAGLVITSSTSAAALFLAEWGPYGMVMDFDDASIAIANSDGSLNYQSQGDFSSAGAPLGPLSKLTYSAPSVKLTEQADGNLGFQAHNLYVNSAAPANQSITTGMLTGATYAITITGSVSITLSGAATGTVTAGTTTFTAASGTLTCGSTSGSGTVHVRRTPSVDTYVATAGAPVYDLPYVYSGGERTGIMVEPAATNVLASSDLTSASWTRRGTVSVTKNQTGPDGVTNSACRVTGLGAAGVADIYETSYSLVRWSASQAVTQSFYIRKSSASGVLRVTNAATGTLYYSVDFSLLGSGWERITPTHPAVTLGTLTATAGGIFGPLFVVTSGTLDFDIYVPQLEAGTVATSPIITYGAAVLRALDYIYINTSAFPYSATELLLYAEAITPVGGFQFNSTLLSLTNNGAGGAGQSAYIQANPTSSNSAWWTNSVSKNFATSPTAGSVQKIAGTFNTAGTLAAATNQGQAVATSAASAWNGTSNRVVIGALESGAAQSAKAVIRRIMISPEYSTAKIQALTT